MELPRAEMEVAGPKSFEFFGPDDDDPAVDDEPPWNVAEPAAQTVSSPSPIASQFKLMTAAQMLEPSAQRLDPEARTPVEAFQLGMLVEHPDYGTGLIKSLSGKDKKRVAVVCFAHTECSFQLAHSPLRPIAPNA
jgi:hypothetical protein